MKKPTSILVRLALAAALAALAIALLPRGPAVSMTFLEYKRWPHGAMVRLSNHGRTTIRCLAERNGTPAGNPVLRSQKTPEGWSGPSPVLGDVSLLDPRTGKMTEVLFLRPATQPRGGDRFDALTTRELKPGQSEDFFIWLEPGAAPLRVGTICLVPRGRIANMLRPWIDRLRQWCRLAPRVPGQVEVWCPEPLSIPALGEPGGGN